MIKSRIERAAQAFADGLVDEELDRADAAFRKICTGCWRKPAVEVKAGKSPMHWQASTRSEA